MRLNDTLLSSVGATSRRNPLNTTGTGVTPMDIMQRAIANRNEQRLEKAFIEEGVSLERERVEKASDKSLIMFAVLGLAYWGLK